MYNNMFIFSDLYFQFMNDRVNAMKDYQSAILLDPTYSLAYFNAANMYFHTRHFRQVRTIEFLLLVFV